MDNIILVVDDEKMITEVLSNLIKTMLKCTVICSNDPMEALKQLKNLDRKPDMIISDFLMPEMNGLEFLKEAKKICPEAVLIFLTGYADKENAIKSINELGLYQYLEKPWDNDTLIKVITNGLEKKELKDKLGKKNIELQAANHELENLYRLMKEESQKEMDKFISVITSLIRLVEKKDKEKTGHSRRVALWSEKIGIKLELSEVMLRNLKTGALLHDIGKLAIPSEILSKGAKLTEEQKKLLESHPVIGEEICKPLNSLKACLKIIRCHHELLNGKGYPDGLSGEEIPLEARIVTVADIFDSRYSMHSTKDGLAVIEMNGVLKQKVENGEIDPIVEAAFWKVCNKENLKEIYTDEE